MASETLSFTTSKRTTPIKGRLLAVFIVLGVVFWFSGMMIVRIANSAVFTAGNPLLPVMFVLAFPLLAVTLIIAHLISRVPLREMFEPTVIMTFTALFLDGSVITFIPHLYADDPIVVMRGAAWIMWGGAVGLLLGWLLSKGERALKQ